MMSVFYTFPFWHTELKVVTFDTDQPQQQLSVSLSGDQIKIQPKDGLKDRSNGEMFSIYFIN